MTRGGCRRDLHIPVDLRNSRTRRSDSVFAAAWLTWGRRWKQIMRRSLAFLSKRTLPGGFDAVIVINLRERVERWKSLAQQLRAAGFDVDRDVTRYDAVVGKNVDADVLARRNLITDLGHRRLRRPIEQRIWGMDLTAGGLGCALSHVHLWSQIAVRGLERVLVLEDDSLLQPDFVARFNEAWASIERHDAVRDAWGLVYVSGLDTENVGSRLQVAPGLRLVPRMHRTTNGYVINARGARSLL